MSLAESATPKVLGVPVSGEPVRELTRALTRADEEAYRKFFALYARRLFLYALALTNGDEESARELLQLTMIRVTKYIREFEHDDVFWGWLRNLVRSCWIDEHRRKKRYWSFLNLFRAHRENDELTPAGSDDPCAALLESLDNDERELLQEKYLEGRSIREIAALRNSTEKAVESKLSRTREKLRKLLAK